MKRIGLTLMAIVLVAFPMFSQTVSIPDTAFLYALIEEGVDTNGDSLISYPEAEAVTDLHVFDNGISDMTGIEAFINLENLDCHHNDFDSLDLSSNLALRHLKLQSCRLFNCFGGALIALDISNNAKLESLSCSGHPLTNLDVSKNTALKELYCRRNQLTSLDISNNTALEVLFLSDSPTMYEVCVWEGFAPISYSPEAPILDSVYVITHGSPNVYFTTECVYNNDSIVFIPDSAFLNALIDEGVDTNGDSLISYTEAEAINSLSLAGSPDPPIHDLTGIEAFVNLDSLSIIFHPIETLDLSHNTSLKYLLIRDAYFWLKPKPELSYLNISKNTALQNVKLSTTGLKRLDVSNNINIQILDISESPTLTEVCVWETPFPPSSVEVNTTGSPNVYFTTECSYNDIIYTPDTRFLAALIARGFDRNEDGLISVPEAEAITYLDITAMPTIGSGIGDLTGMESFINLDTLKISNNEFPNLDVSKNSNLKYLECHNMYIGGGGMYSLDITGCTQLRYLDCSRNWKLTSLDISNCPNLKYIDISDNYNIREGVDICVWTMPFPPEGVFINTDGISETRFSTSCLPIVNSPNNNRDGDSTLPEIEIKSSQDGAVYIVPTVDEGELDIASIRQTCLDSALVLADSVVYLCVSGLPTWCEIYARDCNETLSRKRKVDIDESEIVCNNFFNHPIPENHCASNTVGLTELNTTSLYVYPNPATDFFTIETDNPDHYSINITTLNGQQLHIGEMEGTSHQIDLSTFQKGVYFISIRSKDFVTTRKIIKL